MRSTEICAFPGLIVSEQAVRIAVRTNARYNFFIRISIIDTIYFACFHGKAVALEPVAGIAVLFPLSG